MSKLSRNMLVVRALPSVAVLNDMVVNIESLGIAAGDAPFRSNI